MALSRGQKLSHYELLEAIGQGGMGEVWRARDGKLGREVALKVLSDSWASEPSRLALFEREAQALATLNHPNIVTIFSVEQAGGVRFITMELVRGRTLAEILAAERLPLPRLVEIATSVCEAVATAHSQAITHRDLKSGNIMIGDSGRVKVLDFGLARQMEPRPSSDAPFDRTITAQHDQGVTGTLAYMSPEQVQGLPVDHRSDIYSLGIILYEMATGRKPFEAENPAVLISAVLRDNPSPPTKVNPGLPLRLGRIILTCLEKDPRRRWPTVGELARRLREVQTDLESSPRAVDRSIAVLPFSDMSPAKDQDYLCEGMAEEIMIALGKVKGLRVASRPTAFRLKAEGATVAEIGERLSVGTILDGSVRKSGKRLRITVELIDAADGFRLWADRYDREMRDVFSIQDEIAEHVVEALQMTLDAKDRAALRTAAPPDADAYDYYLRGRKYFYKYDKRGITFARGLFDRAIALDPSFARACAGLADCNAYLYLFTGRYKADLDRATAAAAKAAELDPNSAEAHASLGTTLSLSGKHGEAEAAFEQAIRLNPDLFEAHYFYARDSFAQGNFEKAVREYEAANRVRPEDYQSPLLVAQIYDDLGRSDQGAVSRRKGIALAEEHLQLNPDDARALYMGANGLVALGEVERGLEWAGRALDLEPRDSMVLYNVACVYSLAGKKEEALDCLEVAIDEGLTQKEWLLHDSNFDPVRGEARFKALLERFG
jgi:serine/threonine protein kinase/tetratricopeptide (TPR) repeat protein